MYVIPVHVLPDYVWSAIWLSSCYSFNACLFGFWIVLLADRWVDHSVSGPWHSSLQNEHRHVGICLFLNPPHPVLNEWHRQAYICRWEWATRLEHEVIQHNITWSQAQLWCNCSAGHRYSKLVTFWAQVLVPNLLSCMRGVRLNAIPPPPKSRDQDSHVLGNGRALQSYSAMAEPQIGCHLVNDGLPCLLSQFQWSSRFAHLLGPVFL